MEGWAGSSGPMIARDKSESHNNGSDSVETPRTTTHGRSCENSEEYHPREWADPSSPAYKRGPLACFLNPTHGSGWIVQVQPTKEARPSASPNPIHGSAWIVQVQPTNDRDSTFSSNTTQGSERIVQAQPTKRTDRRSLFLLSL